MTTTKQVSETARTKAVRLAQALREAQRLIDSVYDEMLADITITAVDSEVVTDVFSCLDEDAIVAAAEALESFAEPE